MNRERNRTEEDEQAETAMILAELKRRDLAAAPPAERAAREAQWNANPPCPDCGSYDHFEC